MNGREFLAKIGFRRAKSVEKDWLYFDLTEAVSEDACPICRLLENREKRQMEFLFYENVNDPGTREKLRNAGGMCKWHTRLFLQEGDALGLSILAKDLLSQFQETPGREGKNCPLCEAYEENERRIVQAVAGYLKFEEFWSELEKSPGLCLRHFEQVSARISGASLRQKLEEFERRKMEEIQAKLEEIIRKNDYHSQGEKITEDEAQAIQIAWKFLQK